MKINRYYENSCWMKPPKVVHIDYLNNEYVNINGISVHTLCPRPTIY